MQGGTPDKRFLHVQTAHDAQRRLQFGSPLIAAVKEGNLKAVEAVLRTAPGSIINAQDADGNTALHLVTSQPILLRLLDAGPDLTITNDAGCTAVEVQRDDELRTILEEAREVLRAPIPQVTEELRLVSLKI
jgi:ankyrin repeat protein